MSRIREVNPPEKGILFPIGRGREGFFQRSEGLETIASNIVCLLYTRKGEYPNDPNFGVGIEGYLFELQDQWLSSSLEGEIEKQFVKYMSNVGSLVSVEVVVGNEDKTIDVKITARRVAGKRDLLQLNIHVAENRTIVYV